MVFALLGPRWRLSSGFAWGLTALLVFIRLLRIGDGFQAKYYSTTFSLFMDVPLLPELFRLYYTTVPHSRFAAVCIAIVAGFVALIAIVFFAVRLARRSLTHTTARVQYGILVVLFLAAAPLAAKSEFRVGFFGMSAIPRVVQESEMLVNGWHYRREVRDAVRQVRHAIASHPKNLNKLGGASVYLFLIESYGQTVLDEPVYRSQVEPAYAQIESELAPLGFHMASAILESPTYGGGSWLAHATLGTGVFTNNQFRFRTVRESSPFTLASAFHDAGYTTVLAQPATTRPWPEGDFYHFDHKYYSWNFDYRGPRFSWALMPDQYVVEFINRKELLLTHRRRFVQFALVSSHAPWNVQPPLIEDEAMIRNGRIYDQRPAVTFPTDWSNMSHAGQAYVRAVNYDLDVLRRFIKKRTPGDTLIVILGDHQPNGDITSHSAAHGVPIHILSRNSAFIDVFLSRGYVRGMKPDTHRAPSSMANFFPEFVEDFSS